MKIRTKVNDQDDYNDNRDTNVCTMIHSVMLAQLALAFLMLTAQVCKQDDEDDSA